jgi:hypothetical protein
MFTLLLASFPRLFYLWRCPLLLYFSLVLLLLLLGIGFELGLIPFWGCLSLVLSTNVGFLQSLKPSKMKLGKLFAYPLTELLET